MNGTGRQGGRDLVLRAVQLSDLSIFFEHQCDPRAIEMAGFQPRSRDAFMVHWQGIMANTAVVARSIVAGGRVAGNIVCFDIGDRRAVGYWLGREFWGRGVATAALQAFLEEIPERPLFAYLAAGNLASRRVLEHAGFCPVREHVPQDQARGEEVLMRLDACQDGGAPGLPGQ